MNVNNYQADIHVWGPSLPPVCILKYLRIRGFFKRAPGPFLLHFELGNPGG